MRRRIDSEARNFLPYFAGERIEQLNAVDLIVKQLNAHCQLCMLGREHIDGVTTHAKRAARKIGFIALVLHRDQALQNLALRVFVFDSHRHDHCVIVKRIANAIDARHGGDNNGIAPLQQ